MVAAAAPPPPVLRTAEVQAEIDALLAFRAALRYPYASMAGWDASFPSAPCSWRGVACAPGPAGRVVELQLPRLRLVGPVSPALASLRRLQKLSLRSNALSGAIPPALARLASLRAVFLQRRRSPLQLDGERRGVSGRVGVNDPLWLSALVEGIRMMWFLWLSAKRWAAHRDTCHASEEVYARL